MSRFNVELADLVDTQRIQEHRRVAEQSGVRSTSAFSLNGQAVDVSFGFGKLGAAVHAAIDVARSPRPGRWFHLSPFTVEGSVMPQKAWSAKRGRQCVPLKESLLHRGDPQTLVGQIAARVVNKARAQHGESVAAGAWSLDDMSSSRRGGLRSHQGPRGRPLLQLRNEARQRGLKGALHDEQGAARNRPDAMNALPPVQPSASPPKPHRRPPRRRVT